MKQAFAQVDFAPERLMAPSREEIEAISDADELEGLLADLEDVSSKIKIDLECEIGDDEWSERARAAFAYFKTAESRIERRLKKLRPPEGKGSVSFADKMHARRADLIQELNYHGHFFRAAMQRLDAVQFADLCEAARHSSEDAARSALKKMEDANVG